MSIIMYEQPDIAEEHLRACLQDQYSLTPVTLDFLPLGKDSHAGVYRIVNEQKTAYLVKVTSRSLYAPRYLIPRYLKDQGITAVVAPLPTRENALWTKVGDWTVIVYPFIDGDTSLTGMTDEQWQETGAIFKRIHQVLPPSLGSESLRQETFDPTEYIRWIRTFDEAQRMQEPESGSVSQRTLRSSWITHQSTIQTGVAILEKLSGVLQSRTFPYVICHADLHAANLLRDSAGRVFVIDWDEVMLAPKERDFIFVRQPKANSFFQGYGAVEIDWTLLTYYLWERVIQDLIEYARDTYRDDWGEEARTDAALVFHKSLTIKGGNVDAAYAAIAHLPKELIISLNNLP